MPTLNDAVTPVTGFSVAGVHAGLKNADALDFALIASDRLCVTAGVFTTNQVKAAPVLLDIDQLAKNAQGIRAVAVNTRSANACTGDLGLANAQATTEYVAEKLGCAAADVLVLSTGVIGSQLPMAKIRQGVDLSVDALGQDWLSAAAAIMTTDTRPKYASITVQTDEGEYHIAGISKGAGMIAPNMATMLAVIVTDAGLDNPQAILQTVVQTSFNRIVVDGDTSTNDSVLLLANGASGIHLKTPEALTQFEAALETLCIRLAQDIVRDGEGVTKFITLNITGAPDAKTAHQIANTIAASPLVKTAFFGNDANWGRIIAAAGRSGLVLDQHRLNLWFAAGETLENSLQLVENGLPLDYSEADAMAIVSEASVSIRLDCGLGTGEAVVWTCDLSHDYVTINGDYRT